MSRRVTAGSLMVAMTVAGCHGAGHSNGRHPDHSPAGVTVADINRLFLKTASVRWNAAVVHRSDVATSTRLSESEVDHFEVEETVVPRFGRGREPSALVVFPKTSQQPFTVTESASKVSMAVTLPEAVVSRAETSQGYVVYRNAFGAGTAVVERPMEAGTEDFVLLEEPTRSSLSYRIELGPKVAGLRLVGNTLELVDSGGAPRLRMANAEIFDAKGTSVRAALTVHGCDVDHNAAPPWRRRPVPPKSRECTATIAWSNDGLTYPILVDPAWTTTQNMITQRTNHALLPRNGLLVAIGGYTNNSSWPATELVEGYDPATGTWAAMTPLNQRRAEFAAAVLPNGDIVVAGGLASNGVGPLDVSPATSAERLSAAGSARWQYTGLLREPYGRQDSQAVITPTGDLVICGGNTLPGGQLPFVVLSTCEQFDATSSTWSSFPSMSDARYGFGLVVTADGLIRAVGGQGADYLFLSSHEYIDPSAPMPSWHTAAAMPQARFGAAVVRYRGKAVVIGGESGGAVLNTTAATYDPISNTWSEATYSAYGRLFPVAASIEDGAIIVAGGDDNSDAGDHSNEVDISDSTGTSWSRLPDMPVRQEYSVAALIPATDSLLVTGGCTYVYASPNDVQDTAQILVSTCASDSDCASGFYCDVTQKPSFCAPKTTPGSACTVDSQCTSGSCAGGYCCDGSCGPCGECSSGSCVVRKKGQLGGPPTCTPFVCDGVSSACPSSCQGSADCVAQASCVGNVCSCPSGQSFCAASGRCQPSSLCCSDADCSRPANACYTATGATCSHGSCTFPPAVTCSPGQECANGACTAAQFTFSVDPPSVPLYFSRDMFRDGSVTFSGKLTALTGSLYQFPATSQGTVSVASLTWNGIPVQPVTRLADFRRGVLAEERSNMRQLLSGNSATFPIAGIQSIPVQSWIPSSVIDYPPPGPGTYVVTFQYQYNGPDTGLYTPYHGLVTAAPVTFVVQ
jgi:hypothetical protein